LCKRWASRRWRLQSAWWPRSQRAAAAGPSAGLAVSGDRRTRHPSCRGFGYRRTV
jgi:hypothetical protein